MPSTLKVERDPLPAHWIKALFLRMDAIYGNLWSSRFKENPKLAEYTKREWAVGLAGLGYYFRDALNDCRNGTFAYPPTLPQFKSLCEKYAGIPLFNEAYLLAIKRKFIHPIIKPAFEKVGSWEFSQLPETELRRRFKSAYDQVLSEFRRSNEYGLKLLESNEKH